jgi:hypothetical protein
MNTKTRKPRTTGTEKRARKRWTPYTNKRLTQMKEEGMAYKQIAKKLKRSESSVRQQVRILGLTKTRDHKPRHLVPVTNSTPDKPKVLKIKHNKAKAKEVGKQWTDMVDRLKTLELIEELLNSPKESELIAENIRLKKENADLRSLLKSVQTRVASVFEEVDE